MALNSSRKAIIDDRRRQVAALRLRGLTMREIVKSLPSLPIPIINPRNNQPYTATTIHADIKALEKRWQEEAMRDMRELKSNQLAEIREARRKCWHIGDMAGHARYMKMEIELLGTDAPLQMDIEHAVTSPICVLKADINEL